MQEKNRRINIIPTTIIEGADPALSTVLWIDGGFVKWLDFQILFNRETGKPTWTFYSAGGNVNKNEEFTLPNLKKRLRDEYQDLAPQIYHRAMEYLGEPDPTLPIIYYMEDAQTRKHDVAELIPQKA